MDYATSLAGLLRAGLIDDTLASGAYSGYCFILVSNNADTWHAHANPAIPDTTGERWFFVDETEIGGSSEIRFSTIGLATAAREFLGGGGEPGVVDESQSELGVLTAARGVAAELFPNDPRQEVELGKDERLRTWTTWYQKKVGERLQLGAANEEGNPTIPLP